MVAIDALPCATNRCQRYVTAPGQEYCWHCRRELGMLPPRRKQPKRETTNYTDAEFGSSTEWLRRPLR